MNFQFLNSFFKYTKAQQIGILLLFTIIVALQFVFRYSDFTEVQLVTKEEKEWLGLQQKLDVIKEEKSESTLKRRPYNPNFITDYKGYKLGMSINEIDRLFAFRKQNKYVNSAQEFQDVTKISDSLLKSMAPYFKFPDWVKTKKSSISNLPAKKEATIKTVIVKDINLATAEDLIAIYGIGEALSQRVLSYKQTVGGFVSMNQINEIWGLSPEVIYMINKNFKIISKPTISKIAINDASLKELSQFYYFKNGLAKQILIYRSMNGNFNNIEDLAKIKGFPVDKASIIDLYLEF
ncbi:helix-hairpin-helix domain-containing protein [Flavobacterium sp. TAB 87]|uniref:ComEA family DNA-binding protein n=1 Tax=Flavobacterium sp. TAB 87 TaxID=1729581 RepID=UPI00076D8D81|nr:helix-hairpin-helix domain-containing protein [Flavobacterium sp. TAB 87]KVV14248.1 comEA protein [Flavobacterium sp. TAB 87]